MKTNNDIIVNEVNIGIDGSIVGKRKFEIYERDENTFEIITPYYNDKYDCKFQIAFNNGMISHYFECCPDGTKQIEDEDGNYLTFQKYKFNFDTIKKYVSGIFGFKIYYKFIDKNDERVQIITAPIFVVTIR